MKTFLITALILGVTLVSCAKEKTESSTSNDTMSSQQISEDTSMAMPPSDTAAMNASSPGRVDSANNGTMRDSSAMKNQR